MNPAKDEVGKLYGDLQVVARAQSRNGLAMFQCHCVCGVEVVVAGAWLRAGNTTSCGGCCVRSHPTHGHARGTTVTKTYQAWTNMKSRCGNPNASGYEHYGARGIRVCKRWEHFASFLKDMGECPEDYSIERKNVNGNYTPKNCVWIPLKDQSKNRRSKGGCKQSK